MSITVGTIGRVAVRYPENIKITSEYDESTKKFCGVCDEMQNGEKVMNAFKTKPLFASAEIAVEKTDALCKEMVECHNQKRAFNPGVI
jgi:hypothetical protein